MISNDAEFLREATGFAASTSDLRALLKGILARGLRAVEGQRGFIAEVDFDSGELSIQAGDGIGWTEDRLRQRLELHTGAGRGITTFVAATGKPYWTGNVEDDPYYLKYFDGVQSEIAVPIVDSDGRTRGVMNVDSMKRDAFGDRESMLLCALGNMASLAISVDEHRNRERAFVEIGAELAGSMDIPAVLSKVITVASDVLRFEDCSLFLLDTGRQSLTLEASRGRLSEHIGEAMYRLGEGLTGWIAEHGFPIRTTEPNSDPRWMGLHREFMADEIGAFLGVPIENRDGVIGVLRVLRRKSKFPWFQNQFTKDDESVLACIATQLGATLQNLRLMDRVVQAERMAAWGDMSARSAHMMGNRMFAIKGDLDELKYQMSTVDCSEKPVFEGLIKSAQNGVYRLEEILQEFRDFVRATQLTLSPMDVNDIVKSAVEEFYPKRSSVRLELSLARDLPQIDIDQGKLRRCFSELIENSLSFQPEGGLLRVSTSLSGKKEARDLCGLTGKCRFVKIEFSDAGPGVPDSDKTKIFTPFFTSRAKGMGLGLSIVDGIVRAHRGRICEVGHEGIGAKFVIFLPVSAGCVCSHQDGECAPI